MKLPSMLFSIVLAFSGTHPRCEGQVAPRTDELPLAKQAATLEQLREESLARAKEIRVTLDSDGSAVELIENPLLRFGEPTRGNEDGSLWAWGTRGRPLVISEIYRNAGDDVLWIYLMSLTSSRLVQADTPAGRWVPRSLQMELQKVRDTPSPSVRAAERLRQMKAIARRFEAHQFWEPENTRYELRLLVSPVHRYDDPQTELLDGAVFVFAHGTNPEILMFIEAHVRTNKPSAWRLEFASLGSAEMHVTEKDKDVWTIPRVPGVAGQPVDPYWMFSVSAPRGEVPNK